MSSYANTSANCRSLTPLFSPDDQQLVFQSWASDVAGQDFNQSNDLFAWQIYGSAPVPLFVLTTVPAGPGQAPWITWPVVRGRSYRAQFKDSLSDPGWQDLPGSVMLLGTQGFLRDITATLGQRFYRVVAF
jgi:hypothetical protein